MRKSLIKRFCLLAPVLFLSLIIISCGSRKKIKYFQDIPDSGQLKTIAKAEYLEPIIQIDDILNILIQTLDPQSTVMINSANIPSSTSNPAAQASSGYLVDKTGNIEIPILGKISAVGLTTSQLRETIRIQASKYLKDPTVTVRFSNFKISVTGEVAHPGQYIVPNEKISMLDALAMAGDLTIFGKRENVLLIRENQDGTKTPYRVNMNKSDIMSSPFYYLRQNDIIYVEPNKAKAAATDANQARTYSIIGAITSLLVVFISRAKFL